MGKIFISYRRNDSEGEAGRLAADLEREFGEKSVFIDVNAIEPGLDFRGKIQRQIAGCNVLIAIIGPNWAAPRDEAAGTRRAARTDYVHLEISWALKRRLRVIPVLVRGANMPGAKALPEELKRLAVRNAVELRHAHWNSDLQLLVTALRKIIGEPKVQAVEETPAETEVEIEQEAPIDEEIESVPAIEPAAVEASGSSGSSFWEIICLAVFIVVLYFYFTASSPADKPPPQAAPAKRIELTPKR